MRKPYQLPGWTKNSSYYSSPVGDQTHDLPSPALIIIIIIIIISSSNIIIIITINFMNYIIFIFIFTSIGARSAFFSMKAAELKCQNLIVKKVCQVEHFKTFREAIGPELGL